MKYSPVFSVALYLLVFLSCSSSIKAKDAIQWTFDFPSLPDPYGFAGPFAGIVGEGDDRWLVVAGGANFPYEKPFDDALNANGGQPKVWHDSTFVIALDPEHLKAKGEWKKSVTPLPQKLGYGGSTGLQHHHTSLFLGGSRTVDGKEIFSDAVYEVGVKNGSVSYQKVASLPVAVSSMTAVTLGTHVYVFSGRSADGTSCTAWVLDTSASDRSQWQWKSLPWPQFSPDLPARARGVFTMGVRDGKIYVFGGRARHVPNDPRVAAEDINEIHGLDTFRDGYAYTPGKEAVELGSWKRIADLPMGLSAAPSTAVPAGASHLLMLGGVDMAFLRNLLDKEKFPNLNDARQGFDHPGFPRKIRAYHTITNTWSVHGEIPAGQKATVTTPVVISGKEFLIPSGEWSPKLRTSHVYGGYIEANRAAFGVVNWIVVAVYLLGMVGVGYWFMKKEAATTTDDYFRGGQRIPWWVAGLSIFATLLSSITFMAIPALSYASGWNKWSGQWPIILIVPLVVFAYLPFYRSLNLTSAYEYLEARFNLASRLIASAAFMIFHIGRIAIVLYLPALALSSVTNINIYFAIAVIGVLCVVYTVMGGIEAVVWTDAIQALVLLGGALGCFGLVVLNVPGGMGAITSTLGESDKFLSLDWSSWNYHSGTKSGWLFFLGFMFAMLPAYTSGQDVVQRYVTTPSMKEASKSLWMNIFMTLVGSMIFFALGTALYVFYQNSPEKLDPTMASTDGILPFFILQNLPIGVAGLIIAGVFAAAQSTISSSLNSVATAFVTDFYGRVIAPESPDHQRLKVARNVVVLLGVVGILAAAWIAKENLKSAFDSFNMLIGFILGPLAAMFALGIFTKHVGGVACLIGALLGSASIITVTILHKSGVIDVWPLLNGLICFFVTFVSAFVLGFVFRSKPEDIKGLTIFTRN